MKSIELLNERLSSSSAGLPSVTAADFQVIESDVDHLLREISACQFLIKAEDLMEELGVIQELLAKLAFKHAISLPPRLRRLVREFDRSDDPDLRVQIFTQIRNGDFLAE